MGFNGSPTLKNRGVPVFAPLRRVRKPLPGLIMSKVYSHGSVEIRNFM